MADTKVLLLDRDGVINHDSPEYIKSPEEWVPIPGSIEAISLLCQQGYTIGVATNQSGIGRKLYTQQTLEEIHNKMQHLVEQAGGHISSIEYCPHTPEQNCECRKPRAAMLNRLISLFNAEPQKTYMVGDSYRDIEAAKAANIRPILVLTGNGQQTIYNYQQQLADTPVYADLAAFALALTHNNT